MNAFMIVACYSTEGKKTKANFQGYGCRLTLSVAFNLLALLLMMIVNTLFSIPAARKEG